MSAKRWISVSAAGLATFVLVVATQSVLVPGFDPLRQQISEYVHSSAGAVMVIGFLAWSLSLATLGGLTSSGPRDGIKWLASLQAGALFSAAAAAALLACFATDRGAQVSGVVTQATTVGQIHNFSSALVTASILIAALSGAGRRAGSIRALTLGLILVALASSGALLAIGDPLPGLRQRVLVTAGCLWQAAWLIALRREASPTWPRSSGGSRCSTS